ncbi:hypothetical protein CSV63_09695 [Sporosarcina sp. P34]|nr:hypothetical protein CSV63_09695 [Sporosarcina sp. P34]
MSLYALISQNRKDDDSFECEWIVVFFELKGNFRKSGGREKLELFKVDLETLHTLTFMHVKKIMNKNIFTESIVNRFIILLMIYYI